MRPRFTHEETHVEIRHRTVEVNGIVLHLAESGTGPLVLLLHGFPELWYSYRHQLPCLAEAGYHAVAPDLRGYGRSSAPRDRHSYTQTTIVGDIVALITALGADSAVVVGHDWGSPVASNTGLFRPDLVRGVVLLSVPYQPRGETDMLSWLERTQGRNNYQTYFQTDAARAELDADLRHSLRSILVGLSGDNPNRLRTSTADGFLPTVGKLPDELPSWLSEDDLDVYVDGFSRNGFLGPLNWYRVSRENWTQLAAWHHAPLRPPTLFVGGTKDPVMSWPGMQAQVERLAGATVPNLVRATLLDGCGHWTQQERPDEVNQELLAFLDLLDS